MDLSETPYQELVKMAKERQIETGGVKKEKLIELIALYDANPNTTPVAAQPPAEPVQAPTPTTPPAQEPGKVVLSEDQFKALMARMDALEKGNPSAVSAPADQTSPEIKQLFATLAKSLQKETNDIGIASFGTVPAEDRLPDKHIFYTRAPQLHLRFLMIGPAPEGLPRGMKIIHFERVFNPVQVKYEGNPIPSVVNLLKYETYDSLVVKKMKEDARYGIQWFDSVGEAFRASVDDTLNRLLEQQRLALRSNPDPNHIFAEAQREGIQFDKLDNPFKVGEMVAQKRAQRLYADTLSPVKTLVDYHARGELLKKKGDDIPSVLQT